MLDDVLRDLHMEDTATNAHSRYRGDDTAEIPASTETRKQQESIDPLRRTEDLGDNAESQTPLNGNPIIAGPIPVNNSGRQNETSGSDIVLGGSLPTLAPNAASSPHSSPPYVQTATTSRQETPTGHAASKPSDIRQAPRSKETNNIEMQDMETRSLTEPKRPTVTAQSRSKPGGKEEHGGGCRCVVM